MSAQDRPYFSIVVPCYNVGRYVDDCVRSVRSQPFQDWECILSVEKSTDDTLVKCRAAARQDARFQVVEGPKSGSPATPRNRGLAVAKGRYVLWLDGDDLLADNILSRLQKEVETHNEPEVLQGAAPEYLEDECGNRTFVTRHFNFHPSDLNRVVTGEQVMIDFSRSPRYILPMATLSVCRVDFLKKYALSFQPGLKYEDNEWSARVLTFATRFLPVDADIYIYRRRGGSITTDSSAGTDFVQYAEVVRHLLLFFASQRLSRPLSQAWARRYLSFFFDIYFTDRYPVGSRGFSAREWCKCLHRILEKGGWRAYLKLTRFAGALKKCAVPFVLLCGITPILDWPAKVFFRRLYYPLGLWSFRRRHA